MVVKLADPLETVPVLTFWFDPPDILTSNDPLIIKKRSIQLIELNNKRKKIEKDILENISFKEIESKNKNIIVYYKPNIHEGLIGIIAARLKEHFNKPSIVITNSNNIFKGSARSTNNYNIGHLIKILSDKKIIEKGGGHNMAAGFIIKKNNIKTLDDFIQKDFLNKNDAETDKSLKEIAARVKSLIIESEKQSISIYDALLAKNL